VLLSSLLVGAEPGGAGAGNYRALNLLGGVLDEKRVAEDYLRASALDWVVVRAGVLASRPQGGVIGPPPDLRLGLLVCEPEDLNPKP